MMYISILQLQRVGACSEQVELFRETFGERVKITVETAIEHANKFDWTWAASLLTVVGRTKYNKMRNPAQAEYDKILMSAQAEYNKMYNITQAIYNKIYDVVQAEYNKILEFRWAEYSKMRKAMRAEYDKTLEFGWDEYNKMRNSAQAEYNKTCAAAWATCALEYGLSFRLTVTTHRVGYDLGSTEDTM